MKVFVADPQINIISEDVPNLDLRQVEPRIFGISVEADADSDNDLLFSYNNSSFVRCIAGGPARGLGGFIGGAPVIYNGRLSFKFATDNPVTTGNKATYILTSLACSDIEL